MIGLGTQLFDIDGSFVFYNTDIISEYATDLDITKRLSKVKTLDGGVYIDDSGYSAGDTDIKFTVRQPSLVIYNKLADIFKYHSLVYLTSISGNYLCAPYTLRMSGGDAILTFMTKDNA